MSLRFLACFFCATLAWAAEPDPSALTATETAARLRAAEQGNSYVRLKMETTGPQGGVLQIQIKARRSLASVDLVYQVLWPKERKGEAVLLHKSAGASATGTLFVPPSTSRPLDAGQMRGPFFESDLSYEDLIDDFFAWPRQAFVGAEPVDRVPCQILESKPGEGVHAAYASVRTWLDMRRMVPMRIDKLAGSGQVVRRILTTRVANDDLGRPIPADLTVQQPGASSTTRLDGSKIRHGVTFADAEFTPEGIEQTVLPRGPSD